MALVVFFYIKLKFLYKEYAVYQLSFRERHLGCECFTALYTVPSWSSCCEQQAGHFVINERVV